MQTSARTHITDETVGCPFPLPRDHPTFEFTPISETTVLAKLPKLPIFKATGCNQITNRFLRNTAAVIAPSLTYLFNLSIKSSEFPTKWKTAKVTPIFKQKGQRSNPTNYRPISLLPAVGKLLDVIQSSRLLSYLCDHKLISDHQFGFMPGRSTTHQLLYIIDKWSKALDHGNGVAAVFMDFRKAFDRVWHIGLLYKLGLLGVLPSSLKWIQTDLTHRSLFVQIENAMSKPFAISSGIPQGSHLGPVLFTVFINDLPDTWRSSTDIYADDTLLHQTISKHNSTDLDKLQECVTNAFYWAHSWQGQFCPGKTVLLPVGQTATTVCASAAVVIKDESIQVVTTHKHLGLTISSDLCWSSHIENLLQKANRRAGLLRHMSRQLPGDTLGQLGTLPFLCSNNNRIC